MRNITMQEFENTVVRSIQEKFPTSQVMIDDVCKNNHSYRGLTVREANCNVAQIVNLDIIYESCNSITESIESILTHLTEHAQLPTELDVDIVNRYDDVKEQLILYVMNTEWNKKTIENYDLFTVPYMDLSVGVMIYYSLENGTNASIKVSNTLMKKWGNISKEQILEQALKNISSKYQILNMDLSSFMTEISLETINSIQNSEFSKGLMYALTNKKKFNGAAYIYDKDLLSKIGECMGTDYYIIPSSIHDLIIVKCIDNEKDAEEFKAMVKEANDTRVLPEELLSYSVYKYCRKNKEVIKVA